MKSQTYKKILLLLTFCYVSPLWAAGEKKIDELRTAQSFAGQEIAELETDESIQWQQIDQVAFIKDRQTNICYQTTINEDGKTTSVFKTVYAAAFFQLIDQHAQEVSKLNNQIDELKKPMEAIISMNTHKSLSSMLAHIAVFWGYSRQMIMNIYQAHPKVTHAGTAVLLASIGLGYYYR